MSGKGDKRRPMAVNQEIFDAAWTKAFNGSVPTIEQDIPEHPQNKENEVH